MHITKKSQMSMDFLMTYGWAIIIILVALAALFYLGVFSPSCPPNSQIAGNIFYFQNQKFIGNDELLEEAQNLYYLELRNNLPYKVIINNIKIKKGNQICSIIDYEATIGGLPLSKGQSTGVIQSEEGQKIDESCQGEINSCYKFDIEIEYEDTRTKIDHEETGQMTGSFEGVDSYWRIDEWKTKTFDYHLDYPELPLYEASNSVLEIIEEIGSKKPTLCTGELPPENPEQYFQDILQIGGTRWVFPAEEGDCDRTIQTIGFDEVLNYCDEDLDITMIGKGWFHTTIEIDEIFSGRNFYLGGDANYIDMTEGGAEKSNGICINDNMYFYVNGLLVYKGGTSGRIVDTIPGPPFIEDHPGEYHDGDEVILNCGGCGAENQETWCIPAFALSTENNFQFGSSNNIDIRVEDFCKGDNAPLGFSGGMSQLSITMV